MTAIEAVNLTKHYGDVKAVRGIDLAVDPGTIHGFVGPNGAGKSTTMAMLVGVVTPTVGEARIGGEPAGSHAALEHLGYAPQEPVFYESMSARSYLAYMGRLAGVDGSVTERIESLLDWLDLADAADQAIAGFSGGMQRRLGLAQAMVHDPEILILDEPTAELDPRGRASIIETLQALADDGKTVFVSSHVLAELEQFVEAVTVINDGQIVTSGSLADVQSGLVESYAIESTDDGRLRDVLTRCPVVERVDDSTEPGLTVLVDDEAAFARALPRLASEADIGLHEVSREQGLEDAFFQMIESDGEVS